MLRHLGFIVVFSLMFTLRAACVDAFDLHVMGKGRDNVLLQIAERFQPFDNNYAIWQFTEDDEQALEVQYSLKYFFYNCEGFDHTNTWCSNGPWKPAVFFSYTGKFDFYLGTRDSGPVINRTSNPALHLWQAFDLKQFPYNRLKWIDLSGEHRSNGQVVSADVKDSDPTSPTFGQFQTQIEFDNGNHEYFDRISRSANYVKVAAGFDIGHDGDRLLDLSYKTYIDDESNITWGKYAGTDTSIKDFDLFQVKFIDTYFKSCTNNRCGNIFDYIPETTFNLEYTIGKKAFATDSVDVALIFPFRSLSRSLNLPLMIKAHFGPMERLSNYSQSIKSVGFLFAFTH